MATQKQIAANRRNAAKSTGPTSLEGKIRAAHNATRHALSAGYAVLRIEAPDELERLTADAVARYAPMDNEELYAVERIALAKLALLRAARFEAGMFTNCLNHALNDDNVTPYVSLHPLLEHHSDCKVEQTRNYALARGFEFMARQGNSWSLFLRYHSQAERLYRRAVEAFQELRKRRHIDLPNEPNFEAETEENQPLTPPETNPISAVLRDSPCPPLLRAESDVPSPPKSVTRLIK